MTATIEYRTIDKAAWGDGPWQAEPDKRQWQDPATGLPCLIVRGPVGALCGYVGVSPDHRYHGMDYDDDLGLEAHGGLTFSHGCGHGADPSRGICHIAAPGEPDNVWWFGFDCAHCDDWSPGACTPRDDPHIGLGARTGWGTVIAYRDLTYVTEQVTALAAQIKAA